MLSLNRKTDYALVSLCYLTTQMQSKDSVTSAQRIAEQFGLPLPLLMNILKQLRKAGLIRSSRGPQGGYTLARKAAAITLLDVLEAMEGPMQLTPCSAGLTRKSDAVFAEKLPGALLGAESKCRLQGECPVHDSIGRLNGRIQGFLREVSLADLVDSKVDVPVGEVGTLPTISGG